MHRQSLCGLLTLVAALQMHTAMSGRDKASSMSSKTPGRASATSSTMRLYTSVFLSCKQFRRQALLYQPLRLAIALHRTGRPYQSHSRECTNTQQSNPLMIH